jgi:type IV secretory pathway TrbF-like protein
MTRILVATSVALALLVAPAPCRADEGAPEPAVTGRLEIDEVRTWIVEVREVFSDAEQQRRNVDYAYGHVRPSSAAYRYLDAWYKSGHDPFALGKTEQVTPTAGTVIPKGKDTDVVLWSEEIRDRRGYLVDKQHWRATVGFAVNMAAGRYDITSVTWARVR